MFRRLKQSAPQPDPPAWVTSGRHGARRVTTIGPAGGPAVAVDVAGAITPAGATWSLEWAVGADDRWRVPAVEPTLRQELVAGAPAVETSVRIPSGDAVHRCWAVPGAVVIEVENRSPSPFALALSIRPVTPGGPGAVGTVAVEGAHVVVDGRVALVLPAKPGRSATSTGAGGDVVDAVLAGRAGEERGPTSCEDGLASVAVVLPVAHRTTVRCTVPLGDAGPTSPSTVPALDVVVRGWAAQDRTGTQVELPDGELVAAIGAARRTLLVLDRDQPGRAADVAPVVAALAAWGRHAEAGDLVRSLWVRERTDGSFDEPDGGGASGGPHVAALAASWGRRPDLELVAGLDEGLRRAAGWTAQRAAEGRLDDAGLAWALVGAEGGVVVAGEAGLSLAAAAFATLAVHPSVRGARTAVTDLFGAPQGDGSAEGGPLGLASRLRSASAGGSPTAVALRHELVTDGRPTWSWPGPLGAPGLAPAAVLLALRELLVSEPAQGHAAILPAFDPSWAGQGVELLGVPLLGGGSLSCAVRWHGERPALLWDVVGSPVQVRLTAPGLDGGFVTAEPRGEALLAAYRS